MPNFRNLLRDKGAHSVYDYVCWYHRRYGLSPTFSEISKACYLSRTAVSAKLDRLEGWGLLHRLYGVGRGIRVLYWPDGSQNLSAANDPQEERIRRASSGSTKIDLE